MELQETNINIITMACWFHSGAPFDCGPLNAGQHGIVIGSWLWSAKPHAELSELWYGTKGVLLGLYILDIPKSYLECVVRSTLSDRM